MKQLKEFLKSDAAVSFGYIVIAAFLIGGTAIWINFTPIFNALLTQYNVDIVAGQVSVQNQQSMKFHRNVIYIVPIILLIGISGWGYIRALEQKNQP